MAGFLGKYIIVDAGDVKKFYIKRLFRFFPLFFIACTSLYLAGLFLNHDTLWFRNVYQLLSTLTGISGFIKDGQPATFWYMSMIMLFYILTPFLIYKKVRVYKFIFVFIILSTLVLLFNGDKRVLFYFIFYSLGIMQLQCIIENKFVFCVIGLIYLLISVYFDISSILTLYNIIVVCIGCICGISFCNMISNKININIIRIVAYSSMSLYLFHRHIFAFAKMLTNGDYWPIWMWPIVIVFAFVFAFYIQLIYDKLINKINHA